MYLFLNTDHHLSIQAKAKHEMLANLVLPTFVEEFSRPPKLERRNTFAFQASVMRSKKDGKFINRCYFGFQRNNLRFLVYNCIIWHPSYRFHEFASFLNEFSALKFPHWHINIRTSFPSDRNWEGNCKERLWICWVLNYFCCNCTLFFQQKTNTICYGRHMF